MGLFKRRSKRAKRVASNNRVYEGRRELWEALVKEVGEEQALDAEGQFYDAGFRCECNRDSCVEPLQLSLDEYQTIRSVSTHFAVHPGHEDGEALVSRSDSVVVVYASTSGD